MLKNHKGVSLIELIVYIGVLSVVMLVVSNIFLSINRGRGKSESRVEVNSNLRFIADRIALDLRSVTSSANVIVPATTSTPSSTLVFVVGSSTISYSTSSAKQMLRTLNTSQSVLSSDEINIDSLTFTRIENNNSLLNKTFVSLQLSITAGYNSQSTDWVYSESYRSIISLR